MLILKQSLKNMLTTTKYLAREHYLLVIFPFFLSLSVTKEKKLIIIKIIKLLNIVSYTHYFLIGLSVVVHIFFK